jgi:hypothetical protein
MKEPIMTKTEIITTLVKCAESMLRDGDVKAGATLTSIAQSVDESLMAEEMPQEPSGLGGIDFSSLGKANRDQNVVQMKTPEPAIVEQMEREARGEVPASFNVLITGFNVPNYAKAQQTMEQLKKALRAQTGNEDIVLEITNVKLNK